MGGVFFCIYANDGTCMIDIEMINGFQNLKHRGIDSSIIVTDSTMSTDGRQYDGLKKTMNRLQIEQLRKQFTFFHGYHRMAINDLSFNGDQPFELYDKQNMGFTRLLCNGELYNHKQLQQKYKFNLQSKSDVEIILHMYKKLGLANTLSELDGEYTFVITENLNTIDYKKSKAYIVRDYLGSKPIFLVYHTKREFFLFTSELKGIPRYMLESSDFIIEEMPPGTVWSFSDYIETGIKNKFNSYVQLLDYMSIDNVLQDTDNNTHYLLQKELHRLIKKSIVKRFTNSEHSVGILLSGGFDSSLLASIVLDYASKNNYNTPVHLFTACDSADSSDLKSSKSLIKFFNEKYPQVQIRHHIVCLNNFDYIKTKVEKIIEIVESYDEKCVEKAIFYYYLLDFIKNKTDVKIVLTGEGIHEMIGNKMYYHCDDSTFQKNQINALRNMYRFTLKTLDKISSYFNMEIRYPYLDTSIIELLLNIHPNLKKPVSYSLTAPPIDKYIIRKAFEMNEDGVFIQNDLDRMLPKDIIWKSHFTSTSSNWIQSSLLEEYNTYYSDQDYHNAVSSKFYKQIKNKKQLYYKKIYDKYYPKTSHLHSILYRDVFE